MFNRSIDKGWMERFRSGDSAVSKEVFERYYKPLCSYVYGFTHRADVADDLVQDIFLSLWNHRRNFDDEKKIASFLFVAARNLSINSYHEKLQPHYVWLLSGVVDSRV